MIGTKFGKANPLRQWYAPVAPCPKALRRKPECLDDKFSSYRVDQRAIWMFMSGHPPFVHATLIGDKHKTLIEIHGADLSTVAMEGLGARIRQRIDELHLTQAEAARA